jgi:heat shock protein HtpX
MVWTFIKTTLLIGLLTGILFAVAYLLGFSPITALGFAAFMNLIVYWFSDKFVLRMGGARLASEEDAPRVYSALRRLSAASGSKMPKVALVESPIPNAFATGRSPNNATVAVHTGLLNAVNDEELESVLAHELTHVRNWDTLTSTIVATVAGAISYLAQWGWFSGGAYGYGGGYGNRNRQGGNAISLLLMMVLAPLAAMLVQLTISRTREYSADEGGAKLSGKPQALASALQKIDMWNKRKPAQNNPAMASLYIINPFRGSFVTELFSTHPATEKRIARLERLAATMGYGPFSIR